MTRGRLTSLPGSLPASPRSRPTQHTEVRDVA